MKTTFRKVLFLFLLLNFVTSCNKQSAKKKVTIIGSEQIKKISAGKDICQSDSNYVSELITLTGIRSIKKRFDGKIYRFWEIQPRISDGIEIIEIENKGSKWRAAYTQFKFYNDKTLCVNSVVKEESVGIPKSGWKELINKLDKLGINKLKKYNKIPGYVLDSGDGDQLTIEIASDSVYQYYPYPFFRNYYNKLEDVIAVKEIIELLNEEFGFNLKIK